MRFDRDRTKRKDIFSKKRRSEIMASIKSEDTGIEKALSKFLSENNIKHRHGRSIIGKPDFIIQRTKIAIFCDGDFWHGKNYYVKDRDKLDSFWRGKIEKNMERDKRYNRQLRTAGWSVLRFWGSDILKSPQKCLSKIKRSLRKYE